MSSIEHGSAAEGLPGTGVVDVVVNDAQVVRVPIHEVDEPLVGVPVTCRNHPRVRNDGPSKFQVRADVARRLVVADAALGSASLVVVEGHIGRQRSRSVLAGRSLLSSDSSTAG